MQNILMNLLKKNGSQSTDQVGIVFFPNFSDLSAKLGRVKVAEYNLKIKRFVFILHSLLSILVGWEQMSLSRPSRRDGTKKGTGYLLQAKHG